MIDLSPIVDSARIVFFAVMAAICCVTCLIGWFYRPGSWFLPMAAVVFALIGIAVASQAKTTGSEFVAGKRPDRLPESHQAQAPRIIPRITLALLIAT
ncbi:Uncharacterised protein [Pandoraea sputorum]|uniref:Uncharacterized protein n=1 Tax=Pandoraea sputorum TaxID=93222 RepID=A0A239SQ64_9BURK|nr:hypothetical protein THI4931_47130 [Pandoraea sputorum]SNU87008.1 Uncharacterised protein [Pandoraea sputorum]